jgi:ArsR family transcriptional regulator
MKKCCHLSFEVSDEFTMALDFLKIIQEPNRLKILRILKKEPQCVCMLLKTLNIPQNLASHHFKVLKDFGLIKAIQDPKEKRKIIYSLHLKNLQKHTSFLHNFLTFSL